MPVSGFLLHDECRLVREHAWSDADIRECMHRCSEQCGNVRMVLAGPLPIHILFRMRLSVRVMEGSRSCVLANAEVLEALCDVRTASRFCRTPRRCIRDTSNDLSC